MKLRCWRPWKCTLLASYSRYCYCGYQAARDTLNYRGEIYVNLFHMYRRHSVPATITQKIPYNVLLWIMSRWCWMGLPHCTPLGRPLRQELSVYPAARVCSYGIDEFCTILLLVVALANDAWQLLLIHTTVWHVSPTQLVVLFFIWICAFAKYVCSPNAMINIHAMTTIVRLKIVWFIFILMSNW